MIDEIAARFGVVLGDRFPARRSWVAPATRLADGRACVVKVPLADAEPYVMLDLRFGEADAMAAWGGDGAASLLAVDDESGAMLLERVEPGVHLLEDAPLEEADDVVSGLLPRLWRSPVPGLPTTSELADLMTTRIEGADVEIDSSLRDDALAVLADLRWPVRDPVLVHGDVHHKNVLRATREPWLVIDPLPCVGDRCVDLVMFLLLRKGGVPSPEDTWGGDVDRLCASLDLDSARVRQWLLARVVCDAVVALSIGELTVDVLESHGNDLWTARLVRGELSL